MPLASLNFHDHNGELAAVGALLEVVPISGALLTLNALHTTRDTAASIVEQHGADYLLTVKMNCPETYEALATMPWEQATGRFCEDPEKGHGRIDRRHIEVLTPPKKTINYPHVAQVFRVRRERDTRATPGRNSAQIMLRRPQYVQIAPLVRHCVSPVSRQHPPRCSCRCSTVPPSTSMG